MTPIQMRWGNFGQWIVIDAIDPVGVQLWDTFMFSNLSYLSHLRLFESYVGIVFMRIIPESKYAKVVRSKNVQLPSLDQKSQIDSKVRKRECKLLRWFRLVLDFSIRIFKETANLGIYSQMICTVQNRTNEITPPPNSDNIERIPEDLGRKP